MFCTFRALSIALSSCASMRSLGHWKFQQTSVSPWSWYLVFVSHLAFLLGFLHLSARPSTWGSLTSCFWALATKILSKTSPLITIISLLLKTAFNQAWRCMSIIPALWRLRQENHLEFRGNPGYTKFKTSLNFIGKPCLKTPKTNKRTGTWR